MIRWMWWMGLVLTASCVATGREGVATRIGVAVENDLQPPTSITVWALDDIGTRRLLGNVSPLETRSFSLNPTAGAIRLLARTTGGREIVSERLTALGGETLRWDLSANVLLR